MRVLRPKAWWDLQAFQRELQRIGGDNLVAYWPLDDVSGTTARDIGPNAEVLDITGTTLGQNGPPQLGRSHGFDGINDVLSQHPFEDETGASWGPTVHGLSLADGVAFIRTEGVDLSAFAGTEGSDTPYMLVLSDGSKVAWGYIGAADAAEGLGADLFDVGAGVFTAGTYSWTTYGTNTIANDANTLKVTYVDNAAGALLYLRDTADLSSNLTIGKLYKLTFDTKVGVGDNVTVSLWSSGYSVLSRVVTETDFTNVTWYFTADSANNMYIRQGFMGAGEDIWFDNIVLTEVTHVGTDAVHIVSTRNGSTRNWAGIGAGFGYNDSAYTFEVRKTLFQITGSFTIGSWLNAADATDFIVVDKLSGNYGYLLNLDGSDFVNCTVGDGTDTQSATGAVAVTENQWHRVIATYDGTNIRIYLDGVLIDTQAQSAPGDVSKALSIGSDGTDFAEGNQAHEFICNVAWTAAQVKRDWDVGSRAHRG